MNVVVIATVKPPAFAVLMAVVEPKINVRISNASLVKNAIPTQANVFAKVPAQVVLVVIKDLNDVQPKLAPQIQLAKSNAPLVKNVVML